MKCIAFAILAILSWIAPACALTNDNGIIVFTQADVNNGGITPGDTPGFPVTLSQPGKSYRLGSGLTVTFRANGIEARANDLTIDMAGFTLAGSGVGRNGVTSFNRTLRISNGNVRGFTLDGVRSIAQALTVQNMIISSNGRDGVVVLNPDDQPSLVSFASVSGSKVMSNGGRGIFCGSYCRVENNNVSENGGVGVEFQGQGNIVLGNNVANNSSYGIYFSQSAGGAGNNLVTGNGGGQFVGDFIHMQPNACVPACLPDPP